MPSLHQDLLLKQYSCAEKDPSYPLWPTYTRLYQFVKYFSRRRHENEKSHRMQVVNDLPTINRPHGTKEVERMSENPQHQVIASPSTSLHYAQGRLRGAISFPRQRLLRHSFLAMTESDRCFLLQENDAPPFHEVTSSVDDVTIRDGHNGSRARKSSMSPTITTGKY